MKKQHFLIPLLIFLLVSGLAPSAAALEGPAHEASAVILSEAETGNILYAENADVRMEPASVTKIMTLLLAVEALENGEAAIGDLLTTSEAALADMVRDGSSIDLEEGEEMPFESLLYAVMLESANDASNVLAEYIGGSIPGFVQMMNARAQELGCTDTNFVNPHGLPDENHYSTAGDLLKIAREAISHKRFVDLYSVATQAHPATNMRDAGVFASTNLLLDPNSKYYYEYASGIKTGHTIAAGYCLVSTAEKDGVSLLAVVMGVSRDVPPSTTIPNHFTETKKLYEWAFETFSYREILPLSQQVAKSPVALADNTDMVLLKPAEAITALVPSDFSDADVIRDVVLYSERDGTELQAPISQGQILGEVTLTYNGNTYGPVQLVAAADIALSGMEFMKTELSSTLGSVWVRVVILLLVLLLILYIVYVVRHSARKRQRRRDRMSRK